MITATNIFVLANILYAASYLVRDILWLRALAVTAAASSIPYFYLQPTPQFWPIFWQCAFIAINLVHAVALVRERMPVDMTESEKRLHLLAFRTLRPRELLRLSRTAQWHTARPGAAGQPRDSSEGDRWRPGAGPSAGRSVRGRNEPGIRQAAQR